MKKVNQILLLLSLSVFTCFGQTIEDVYITKDAFVETRVGDTSKANTNFGTHQLAPAHAWTNGGNTLIRRFLFDIDLSGIPANSLIELYT